MGFALLRIMIHFARAFAANFRRRHPIIGSCILDLCSHRALGAPAVWNMHHAIVSARRGVLAPSTTNLLTVLMCSTFECTYVRACVCMYVYVCVCIYTCMRISAKLIYIQMYRYGHSIHADQNENQKAPQIHTPMYVYIYTYMYIQRRYVCIHTILRTPRRAISEVSRSVP